MSSITLLSDGTLPHCTDYGCYPLYYVTSKDDLLCPTCANQELKQIAADKLTEDDIVGFNYDPVIACDINYESLMYCDECSKQIDSAYGVYDEQK